MFLLSLLSPPGYVSCTHFVTYDYALALARVFIFPSLRPSFPGSPVSPVAVVLVSVGRRRSSSSSKALRGLYSSLSLFLSLSVPFPLEPLFLCICFASQCFDRTGAVSIFCGADLGK